MAEAEEPEENAQVATVVAVVGTEQWEPAVAETVAVASVVVASAVVASVAAETALAAPAPVEAATATAETE